MLRISVVLGNDIPIYARQECFLMPNEGLKHHIAPPYSQLISLINRRIDLFLLMVLRRRIGIGIRLRRDRRCPNESRQQHHTRYVMPFNFHKRIFIFAAKLQLFQVICKFLMIFFWWKSVFVLIDWFSNCAGRTSVFAAEQRRRNCSPIDLLYKDCAKQYDICPVSCRRKRWTRSAGYRASKCTISLIKVA